MREPVTVLVVDDEETIRRACERILTEEGYRVTVTTRGEEALGELSRGEAQAVVLDLKMPGLGGMETLRRIRDERPDLPVVVITGYATREMKRECTGEGAAVWLAKPFDPEELLDALRVALEGGS